MSANLRLLVVLLILAAAFSGCMGDDDPPTTTDEGGLAESPEPTAETGSIQGKVLSSGLDEVTGAAIAAVAADGALAADTKSDAKGEFTLNGLAPGTYLVQVSAVRYHGAAESVEVEANKVTQADILIEPFTLDELATPYFSSEEWEGFMSCGIGTIVLTWALCAETDDTVAEDPNMDYLRKFNVSSGLKTIIVGVDWSPTGGGLGTDLWVNVEDDGCGLDCPRTRTYAVANEGPPIVLRIDKGPSSKLAFDNMTEERIIQMRVFPGGEASVMYQQPFKVYWHEFYHAPAAKDFNPFPDE